MARNEQELAALALAEELVFLGARPLFEGPKIAVPGPFSFIGDHPDASATVVDLTLIAAFNNSNLLDRYNANDPKVIIQVDAVEMVFENNGLVDSAALVADIFQDGALYWKHGNKEEWLDIIHFAGTFFEGGAVSTTENNTTKALWNRPAIRFELDRPWQINFETDKFEYQPANTNIGAAIGFQLTLHGTAWPNEYGARLPQGFSGKPTEFIRGARNTRYEAAARRTTLARGRGRG